MDLQWVINSIICILFIVAAIWSDAAHNFSGTGTNVTTVFTSILIIVLSLSIILVTPLPIFHPYLSFVIGRGGIVLMFIIACFFLVNFSFLTFCSSGGLSCFEHIIAIIGISAAIIELIIGDRGNVKFGKQTQKSKEERPLKSSTVLKETNQSKTLAPIKS